MILYSLFITKVNEIKWENGLKEVFNGITKLQGNTNKEIYIPVEKDNKYGFITEDGKEKIPCQYDNVSFFYEIEINGVKYYISLVKLDNIFYIISKDNDSIKIEGNLDRYYKKIYTSHMEPFMDKAFKDVCVRDCDNGDYTKTTSCHCDNRVVFLTEDFIEAAGLKASNIAVSSTANTSSSTASYNRNIRVAKIDGVYYAVKTTGTTKLALSTTYNKTRVYINPETGKSCVTLVSKANGDYQPNATTQYACGGSCVTTPTQAANYCKPS